MAQTPPFDTKISVSNPCRLPTYSDKPHVAQNLHPLTSRLQFLQVANIKHQTSSSGPNTHHLIPRLQFFIPVGCQPTVPDKPHVAQNPHPLTPRLQFLIPVGCQPTAPNRPQMPQPHPLIPRLTCRLPTYSTRQAPGVPVGCQLTAPNKPHVAQTPTLWYQDFSF